MFIIKKPESSNKTIRMPNELIDKLEKLAAGKDISFNQLVIQCCEYALNDLPKEEEKLRASLQDGVQAKYASFFVRFEK